MANLMTPLTINSRILKKWGGDSLNLPLRFSKIPQSSLLNPEGFPVTPSMGPPLVRKKLPGPVFWPRLVPEASYAASAAAAPRVSPVPPGSRGQRESYGEPGGDVARPNMGGPSQKMELWAPYL